MELNLNLCNQDKSDISYKIFHFPDGEIQIELGEVNHKAKINVIARIANAEDLFVILQIADILNRQGVEWCLRLTYLMSMRMDRVMDYNRPFSLKIVGNLLKNICDNISVLEPHSKRTTTELHGYSIDGFSPKDFYKDYTIIIPDDGALKRYQMLLSIYQINCVKCSKVRDLETGRITSLTIDNPELISDKPLMIIDDLCDGGGTFCGIAEAVRKIKPNADINIAVTHAVNANGIYKLSENFNKVFITNSYADWFHIYSHDQKFGLPKNVEILDSTNFVIW